MRQSLAIPLLAVLALAACTGQQPTPAAALTDFDALLDARSRWQENEPPAYQYVTRRGCLSCAPVVAGESALVEVSASGITRITPVTEGSASSDLKIAIALAWMGGVVRGGNYYSESSEISYDPVYGYPSSARLVGAYGHGWMLSVTEFELLESR